MIFDIEVTDSEFFLTLGLIAFRANSIDRYFSLGFLTQNRITYAFGFDGTEWWADRF